MCGRVRTDRERAARSRRRPITFLLVRYQRPRRSARCDTYRALGAPSAMRNVITESDGRGDLPLAGEHARAAAGGPMGVYFVGGAPFAGSRTALVAGALSLARCLSECREDRTDGYSHDVAPAGHLSPVRVHNRRDSGVVPGTDLCRPDTGSAVRITQRRAPDRAVSWLQRERAFAAPDVLPDCTQDRLSRALSRVSPL